MQENKKASIDIIEAFLFGVKSSFIYRYAYAVLHFANLQECQFQ